jgi:site-specific recombinase XerD
LLRVASDLRPGPFGRYAAGFVELLRAQGYTEGTLWQKRLTVTELGRWLARRNIAIIGFNEEHLARFCGDPKRRYRTMGGVPRTGEQLLGYLRAIGAVRHAQGNRRPTPTQAVERDFGDYLRRERGVAETTVAFYLRLVHPFVAEHCRDGRAGLAGLSPPEITGHVLRHTRVASAAHAKLRVTALRSFLRFLYVQGITKINLCPAVPTVPNWKLTSLPKYISGDAVRRLLDACDRRTPSGRRDYAALLFLARLGLRASEVAAMTLDDIHWDTAEIDVRGKSGQDRVPLPADVGRALVEYLRRGRPRSDSRQIFLRAYAPFRGLAGGRISDIVKRTIRKARIRTPSFGAHLLRHSLATEILRRGGSLDEIAELLRHSSPQTTLVYAKVNIAALRQVSPPWPRRTS